MSDRIGLKSAKGSSTSGYVQRSLAHTGDRADRDGTASVRLKNYELRKAVNKKKHKEASGVGAGADGHGKQSTLLGKALLDHERKREIEVRVSELLDELEGKQDEDPEKWTDEAIEQECKLLRDRLTKEQQEQKRYAETYTPRNKRVLDGKSAEKDP
ncbi:Pre-mRNA-splicing factor CWC21 [Nakaseomyces bracarensis]|uniref:Pre-mRNA-splicing factor CWC21 n=1 Tax=Nakaseomyces bracarensis TaxID=273131 RepID=A0ABR4NYD2_9SACH